MDAEIEQEKKVDFNLFDEIKEYRTKIKDMIRKRNVHELSKLLDSLALKLDDTSYCDELYKKLRMDIIHGQICLAHYFTWKQNLNQRAEAEGQTLFQNFVKVKEVKP